MGGGQLIEEVPLFAQLVEDELLVDDGAVKRYADIDGVEGVVQGLGVDLFPDLAAFLTLMDGLQPALRLRLFVRLELSLDTGYVLVDEKQETHEIGRRNVTIWAHLFKEELHPLFYLADLRIQEALQGRRVVYDLVRRGAALKKVDDEFLCYAPEQIFFVPEMIKDGPSGDLGYLFDAHKADGMVSVCQEQLECGPENAAFCLCLSQFVLVRFLDHKREWLNGG